MKNLVKLIILLLSNRPPRDCRSHIYQNVKRTGRSQYRKCTRRAAHVSVDCGCRITTISVVDDNDVMTHRVSHATSRISHLCCPPSSLCTLRNLPLRPPRPFAFLRDPSTARAASARLPRTRTLPPLTSPTRAARRGAFGTKTWKG